MSKIDVSIKTIPFLLLICLFVLALRWPYASVSFWTIDESGFAAVANKLSDGHSLYKEACDNKPPFVFYFFAGIFSLFGKGNMYAVHLATLLFVFMGLCFLHAATAEIAAERIAKISTCAFAFYQVASSPSDVFSSTTEIYMVPMIIAGLYFCLTGLRMKGLWFWLAAGSCFGMAGWTKQPGILFCLLVPIVAIVDAYPFKRSSMYCGLRRCAAGFLGFCATSLFWLALMWKEGTFRDFLDMVIFYNTRIQTTSIPAWQSIQMAAYTASAYLKTHFAAILLALIGLGLLLRTLTRSRKTDAKWGSEEMSRRNACILIGWLALALVAVSIGGRFYGYYMYVLAPVVAVLVAVAFGFYFQNQSHLTPMTRRCIVGFVIVGCVVPLCIVHQNYFTLAAEAFKYRENRFSLSSAAWISASTAMVSRYAAENTTDRDQIFVWGYQPYIYVASGRNFATRYFSVALQTGFVWGTLQQLSDSGSDIKIVPPVVKKTTYNPSDSAQWIYPGSRELLLKELRRNPPELFIDGNVAGEWPFGDKYPIDAFPQFQEFLINNYKLEKTVIGYRVYRSLKSRMLIPAIAETTHRGPWL